MDAIAHLNSALAGRYEILREVGAGGMATVYLARDLRHDRDVALKVLNPDLGAVLGPERFLAEIRVTANLQHPHILPLFDSGEAREGDGDNGPRSLFYVMPYVDGESLRARLTREKQLPIDEALSVALAAAHALQYAHAHGVIHRDIKPENILLQSGQPVVADFGIALAVRNAGGARVTQTGVSLGTPQYMSPEQAAGERTIDGRSDIYSLGAVLYEMLTGDPPHTGSTAQAVIARVLTEKSRSVRAVRANVPAHVEAAIDRALEKLPADRFSSAADFAAALQSPNLSAGTPSVRAPSSRKARWVGIGVFAAGLLVGTGLMYERGASSSLSSAGRAPMVRGSIVLPTEAPLALANLPPVGYNGSQVSLSPDGSLLAYIATTPAGNQVYLRDLASGDTRALQGTQGAKVAFFSPDGAWIGFATEDHIKKIPRGGGAAIDLCAGSTIRAWWAQPGFIYYDSELGRVSRVSSDGGTPEPVASTGQLGANDVTDVLPGGQSALVNLGSASINRGYGDVGLADLHSRRTTVLLHSAYAARYVPGGYLLFARAGALFGVRFDEKRGVVLGDPVTVAPGVFTESAFGTVQASTANGVLAYVPGDDISRGKLALIDRHNAVNFIDAPELVYGEIDLAPDDQHIAVHVSDVQDYLWIWNLGRHEAQRVPYAEAEGYPRWSADGRRLAGVALDKQRVALHDVDESGHVAEGRLLPDTAIGTNYFSPSGDIVAVQRTVAPFKTTFVTLRGTPTTAPPVGGDFVTFSPDGKWLAYVKAQRGAPEVFIRSFVDGRDVGQVSQDGGIEPRWKPSGTLYFRNGHRWYETKVTTAGSPRWDPPRLAFDAPFIDTQGYSYDVTRDGQRLLVVKRDQSAHPMNTSRIELISNWTRLLEQKR